MSDLPLLLAQLQREGEALLVTVAHSEGSVPREIGAWMAVFKAGPCVGTIGGGQLENQAIAQARQHLSTPHGGEPAVIERMALGPSLGQCCGGVVRLRFERVRSGDAAALHQRLAIRLHPVALFGGGHVGRALVDVLARLPVRVQWFDSRDEVFPPQIPDNVQAEHSDPVQDAVDDVAAGAALLVMSFSHAEDLDIVARALKRQRERADLPYIGLIGSRTKWATFRHRLLERGLTPGELDRVTCPIGVPGVSGKQPAVIAVAVAAQLLALPAWNNGEN